MLPWEDTGGDMRVLVVALAVMLSACAMEEGAPGAGRFRGEHEFGYNLP